MIRGVFKALAQLTDPSLRRVLRIGILGAVAAYVLLVAAVWATLTQVTLFAQAWADIGTDLAIGLAALVLPILFFPALATAFMGPMLDGVADAVEARHYPHLSAARRQPVSEVMIGTARFLALTVVVNLAALPVYLVLLVTGLTVLLVTAVNGYLLAREYFEMVALRRLDSATMRQLFRDNLGKLWLTGMVIAALFAIPILNLAAPVLGTALMVHVRQSLQPRVQSV